MFERLEAGGWRLEAGGWRLVLNDSTCAAQFNIVAAGFVKNPLPRNAGYGK